MARRRWTRCCKSCRSASRECRGGQLRHRDREPAAIRRLADDTPGLRRLWIFGSRARGDHREHSDIDLAADAAGWTRSDALAFAESLKRLPMVYPVDCVWWQDGSLPPALRRQVERDRRVLWQPGGDAPAGAVSPPTRD